MSRRVRRAVAVAAAAIAQVIGAGACGVVHLVPPEGAEAEHALTGPPTAFLSSCAMLEKAEVEAALGLPVTEPELYLGTDVDNRGGNSCIWESGREGRVSTGVDGRTHGPELDGCDDAKEIDGVGRGGCVDYDGPNVAEVYSHTKDGLGFNVVVARKGSSRAALEQQAVDLARKAADRLTAGFPGTPDALPARTAPPVDPCALLPVERRVQILGWATSPNRNIDALAPKPEPRIGGPGGGGWTCHFFDWANNRMVRVDVSAGPVAGPPPAAFAPVPEPAGALFSEPRPEADGLGWGFVYSAISVTAPDGRRIEIRVRDQQTDAARHRENQIALAKVALEQLGVR